MIEWTGPVQVSVDGKCLVCGRAHAYEDGAPECSTSWSDVKITMGPAVTVDPARLVFEAAREAPSPNRHERRVAAARARRRAM